MPHGIARLLLSLANGLSVIRLLAVPVVVMLLWRAAESESARMAALWLLIGLQASDVLDGFLGRKGSRELAIRNHFGEMIDPIADKLYIGAAFVTLALSGQFHGWFAALLVARDISIVVGWSFVFARSGVRILPNVVGKAADTCEALLLLAVVLRLAPSIGDGLTVLTTGLILYSGVSYARLAIRARSGASQTS